MRAGRDRRLRGQRPVPLRVRHGVARGVVVDIQAHRRAGRCIAREAQLAMIVVVHDPQAQHPALAARRRLQHARRRTRLIQHRHRRHGRRGGCARLLRHDHQHRSGTGDRGAAWQRLGQGQRLAALRQRRGRHQHPAAAAIGRRMADGDARVAHRHLRTRRRMPGDHGVALRIDPHDVETRCRSSRGGGHRRRGRCRGGKGSRGGGRGQGGDDRRRVLLRRAKHEYQRHPQGAEPEDHEDERPRDARPLRRHARVRHRRDPKAAGKALQSLYSKALAGP